MSEFSTKLNRKDIINEVKNMSNEDLLITIVGLKYIQQALSVNDGQVISRAIDIYGMDRDDAVKNLNDLKTFVEFATPITHDYAIDNRGLSENKIQQSFNAFLNQKDFAINASKKIFPPDTKRGLGALILVGILVVGAALYFSRE